MALFLVAPLISCAQSLGDTLFTNVAPADDSESSAWTNSSTNERVTIRKDTRYYSAYSNSGWHYAVAKGTTTSALEPGQSITLAIRHGYRPLPPMESLPDGRIKYTYVMTSEEFITVLGRVEIETPKPPTVVVSGAEGKVSISGRQ